MKSFMEKRGTPILIGAIVAAGIGGAAWAYWRTQSLSVAANRPAVVNALCTQIGLVRTMYAGEASSPNLSGEAMRSITDPAIRPVVEKYRRIDDKSFSVELSTDIATDYPDVAAQVQRISVADLKSGNIPLCAHLTKECPPKGMTLNAEDGNVYVAADPKPRRATPGERELFLACAQR